MASTSKARRNINPSPKREHICPRSLQHRAAQPTGNLHPISKAVATRTASPFYSPLRCELRIPPPSPKGTKGTWCPITHKFNCPSQYLTTAFTTFLPQSQTTHFMLCVPTDLSVLHLYFLLTQCSTFF